MTPRSNRLAPLQRAACGVLVLVLAPLTGVARAANPCSADIAKFCAKVPVGGGRIQTCLKEHEKKLSPECAAWRGSLQKTTGSLAATCRNDIARFCRDVTPGKGAVAECLERNRDKLSPTCRDELPKSAKPK